MNDSSKRMNNGYNNYNGGNMPHQQQQFQHPPSSPRFQEGQVYQANQVPNVYNNSSGNMHSRTGSGTTSSSSQAVSSQLTLHEKELPKPGSQEAGINVRANFVSNAQHYITIKETAKIPGSVDSSTYPPERDLIYLTSVEQICGMPLCHNGCLTWKFWIGFVYFLRYGCLILFIYLLASWYTASTSAYHYYGSNSNHYPNSGGSGGYGGYGGGYGSSYNN